MDYNIVLLYYENGHPTGVIRYIEMLKRGLLTQKKYKIHSIVLDSSAIFMKRKILFLQDSLLR